MKNNIDLLGLLKKAKTLQKNAYAPYSLFRAAALVTLKNNEEILGVNVENAAYAVSICDERTSYINYHKFLLRVIQKRKLLVYF